MDQVLGTLGQGGRTRGTQLELQDICPVLVFNQGYQTQRQVAHVGMLLRKSARGASAPV